MFIKADEVAGVLSGIDWFGGAKRRF